MDKIYDEVIKFIENAMKNWWVELTAEGKSLTEVKIQEGNFQGDALSPLLPVIVMMPLNHIFKKCIGVYKPIESQEMINHITYMNDMKPFDKNEVELETLIQTLGIYSDDIEMLFGIEKCAMLIMRSGKW